MKKIARYYNNNNNYYIKKVVINDIFIILKKNSYYIYTYMCNQNFLNIINRLFICIIIEKRKVVLNMRYNNNNIVCV